MLGSLTRRPAWAALLLLLPGSVHALHPLITEDTGTQGAGVSQVELAAAHEQDRNGDTTTRRFDPTFVLTHGVAETLDVFVSLPYLCLRTESAGDTTSASGWSDPALGFKWRFYEHEGWSFAVKPALVLAHGDEARGLGSGRTGYSLPLVMTRQWSGFAFHTHVALEGNRNTLGERERLWHASVALEHELANGFKWVLDLGADRNPDPLSDRHPAYLLGGIVYAFGRVDLSLGVKGKLNSAAADRVFLFGLTWHGK